MPEKTRRFVNLFKGNDSGYGVWSENGARTYREDVTEELYTQHLAGSLHLGIVPVNQNNECWFGAIDIDAHTGGSEIDLREVEAKILSRDLPLVVCRSKRGGAHVYYFVKSPISAKKMRSRLKGWAKELGAPLTEESDNTPTGIEIFPKQDTLKEGSVGNWINLPYQNTAATDRWCIHCGETNVPFEMFLDVAEEKKERSEKAKKKKDMPPCIDTLLSEGVKEGSRNDAVFNIALYYRLSKNPDWKGKTLSSNFEVVSPPLPQDEVNTICSSVSRIKGYRYRCSQAPLVDICDKTVCLTRKYGIKPETDTHRHGSYGHLRKILTDPPIFLLKVNDKELEFRAEEILDHKKVMTKYFESASEILVSLKQQEWHGLLASLKDKEEYEEIEAPEDTSITGVLNEYLDQYTSQVSSCGIGEKDTLARGVATLLPDEKSETGYSVYFKGTWFRSDLIRRRVDPALLKDLWINLRKIDTISYKRLRVNGGPSQEFWTVKTSPPKEHEYPDPVDAIEEDY